MTKKEIIELIENAVKESEDNFIIYYSKKQVFIKMQFLLKQVKGAK